MSYTEDDLLPLSALQHLLFCERQCALIHIEQEWTENLYTAEGRILHEHVDAGQSESRGDVRIEYSDQHWLDEFTSVYHIEVEAIVHEPGRTWELSRHDELRAMTVGEMMAYLKEAGFADVRAYPSFDLAEADEPTGERMIFVATRP